MSLQVSPVMANTMSSTYTAPTMTTSNGIYETVRRTAASIDTMLFATSPQMYSELHASTKKVAVLCKECWAMFHSDMGG